MEQFPLDDVVPVDNAHLIEAQDKLILQHGGVVTKVNFSKVTRMPLERYRSLREELMFPDDAQRCHVIRDLEHHNITMILNDHVAVYDVTSIEEVPLCKLADNLVTEQDLKLFPDIQYPLVGYIRRPDCRIITVHIDATWFHYRAADIPSIRVMHPPIWLRIKLNNAGALIGGGMVVVRTREPRWDNTRLYQWILPNVFDYSNEICFGSTTLSYAVPDPTDGQRIMALYHQVFDSLWNYHLFHPETVDKATLEAFKALPVSKRPYQGLTASTAGQSASLKRLLSVLTQPDGWRQIQWPLNQMTATDFVTGQRSR